MRRAITAENGGDVRTFLDLWTDDGLRSYDAGSRSDIQSGKARLGVDHTDVRTFASVTVKGSKAQAVVDGAVEIGLYRSRFDLVRKGGKWRMDGFRFQGPTPPPAGAKVVPVGAVEYGYDVDPAALSSGDAAVAFSDKGKEQHEISVLAIPPDATTADAVLALKAYKGGDPGGLPASYSYLGHLAFELPGTSGSYTLARKLTPGRYAFACFLPVGGLDDTGNAKVPDADSHVARGMIAPFTVG